jgi:hypothetical protein
LPRRKPQNENHVPLRYQRHPKAKRDFGWSHPDGEDNKTERFVTVLEIPPVVSPETAVKMAIYSDIKKARK